MDGNHLIFSPWDFVEFSNLGSTKLNRAFDVDVAL